VKKKKGEEEEEEEGGGGGGGGAHKAPVLSFIIINRTSPCTFKQEWMQDINL
jgi:uncharacterized spore protein YtfJ